MDKVIDWVNQIGRMVVSHVCLCRFLSAEAKLGQSDPDP